MVTKGAHKTRRRCDRLRRPKAANRSISLTGFLVLVVVCSLSLQAGAYFESFDNYRSADVEIYGRSVQGSRAYVSANSDRHGGGAVAVDYRFTDSGWVEVHLAKRGQVEVQGDYAWVSMWVRGSGKGHFFRGSVRFRDATGEVFEYPVSGIEIALNQDEWRLFRRRIDLTAPANNWGGNGDGKIDEPLTFLGFVAGYRGPGPAEGTIYFDDVEVVVPSVPNLMLNVESSQDVAIWAPGETVSYRAEIVLSQWMLEGRTLKFADIQSFNGRLLWEIQDWEYRILASGEVPVQLSGGDRIEVPVDYTHNNRDLLHLHVRVVGDDGRLAAAHSTRAAIFPPATEALSVDPHFVAVAAHLQRYDEKERRRMIETIKKTGFGGVRFDVTWHRVEPQRGRYEWELYDAIFRDLHEANIQPLPLIVYNPQWGNARWNDPPPVDDYVTYATRVVERYGSYAKTWELWNEPDLSKFWSGTVEQYVELFNAAFRAIRKVSPSARILNGGFSEVKNRPDFIPRFLELTEELPDIFAFHSHGPMEYMKNVSKDFQGYLDNAGWTPEEVWLNEAGYSARAQQTETTQAAELIKKIAYSAQLGYRAYVWYDLRNDGTDPNDVEHNFGITLADLAPKLGLVTANTVMSLIGGKQALGIMEMTDNGLHAFRFADDDEQVIVLWTEANAREDYILTTGAASVYIANWLGAETTVTPDADGNVRILVSEYPQFIRLTGPQVKASLAKADA